MRTNIEIDAALLTQAMAATGQTAKRATVEEALRTVMPIGKQPQALRHLACIGWEGDLDAMRQDPIRNPGLRIPAGLFWTGEADQGASPEMPPAARPQHQSPVNHTAGSIS